MTSDPIAENITHDEPFHLLTRALEKADAALIDGLHDAKPYDDDDAMKMVDLVADARHELVGARRQAGRIMRDRNRRAGR